MAVHAMSALLMYEKLGAAEVNKSSLPGGVGMADV